MTNRNNDYLRLEKLERLCAKYQEQYLCIANRQANTAREQACRLGFDLPFDPELLPDTKLIRAYHYAEATFTFKRKIYDKLLHETESERPVWPEPDNTYDFAHYSGWC
jgi:hypothetical protein